MGELAPPRRPLRPTGVVLRPALAVATRPDREPEPPSALVVPTGHRPPPRHPRPSPTRRKHHQPPAPPQPPPPKPSRTLCCPHRAVTTGTGRPPRAHRHTVLPSNGVDHSRRADLRVQPAGFIRPSITGDTEHHRLLTHKSIEARGSQPHTCDHTGPNHPREWPAENRLFSLTHHLRQSLQSDPTSPLSRRLDHAHQASLASLRAYTLN